MLGETDSVWYGIVPPAVATVTLRFATGGRGDHHHGPLSVSSNVVNSVYAINIPSNPQGDGWPTSAVWRSKTGHVVKRINETPFHP